MPLVYVAVLLIVFVAGFCTIIAIVNGGKSKTLDLIEAVMTSPREWSPGLRKLYVCTLPLAIMLHLATLILLFFCLVLFWGVGSIGLWIAGLWTGKDYFR